MASPGANEPAVSTTKISRTCCCILKRGILKNAFRNVSLFFIIFLLMFLNNLYLFHSSLRKPVSGMLKHFLFKFLTAVIIMIRVHILRLNLVVRRNISGLTGVNLYHP